MSKIAIIIAPSNFRDEEYFIPKDILESAGHETVTASTSIGEITGSHGQKTTADVVINNIYHQVFDAIIIVGGSGSYQYDNNKDLHSLLTSFYDNGKIVAAICHAPIILAQAGLLNNFDATVFIGDKDELIELGANYLPEPVVVRKSIITADGPQSAKAFGEAIAKKLQDQQ